jgi:hypothetical protein
MIPDHFYMTELGIMAYGFIYLPVAIVAFLLLWKKLRLSWIVLTPIFLAILTLPFWDVYMIGRDADYLCTEQAGLHIYKTVEADGFLGGGGEYWIKYGFSYVETGGIGDKKYRYLMRDGKIVVEEVPEYISRYRIGGETHIAIDKFIARTKYQVIEIRTNYILGELVSFSIYPGRWDQMIIGITGTGSGLNFEVCGNEPPPGSDVLRLGSSDVVRATLKPKKSKEGGQ